MHTPEIIIRIIQEQVICIRIFALIEEIKGGVQESSLKNGGGVGEKFELRILACLRRRNCSNAVGEL